jgi:hypothetical protein
MDLWDVARLLGRRWLVSVPLLLLTIGATAWGAFNIQPDYTGKGYVSLLPPTVNRQPVDGQTLKVNPWDTETLTNAVVVRLNTKSFADQMEREGYKGKWEAGLDPAYDSVVTIEVTAPTTAGARATTQRLLREVDDEVTRQQAKYPSLKPEDKITTTRFDSGDNVEPATGKIKRALVVIFVVGVIITVAVTVSTDALLARRARRRRAGSARVQRGPPIPPVQPISVRQPSDVTAGFDPEKTAVVSRAAPDPEETQVVSRPSAPPAPAPAPAGESVSPIPDDSTIVLPLTNAPWAGPKATNGSPEKGKDKTAEAGKR